MNSHLVSSITSPRAAWVSTFVALVSMMFSPSTFAAAAKPGGGGGDTGGSTSGVAAESRIPIGPDTTPGDNDSTPSLYKITQPGSYFLTGNLAGVAEKAGIEIAVDNVTIDLNGFTLRGAGSGQGIRISGHDATVRDGVIAGWGYGIIAYSSADCRYARLRVSGSAVTGMYLGPRAVVTDCTVADNVTWGILVGSNSVLTRVTARGNLTGFSGWNSRFVDCIAVENRGTGIMANGGTLTGCSATDNQHAGIALSTNAVAEQCTALRNGENGFHAGEDCVLKACTANLNDASGFGATTGVLLSDCTATANALDGFNAQVARIENCTARSNHRNGFSLGTRSQIRGSLTYANFLHGIAAEGFCHVSGNHATGNGAYSTTGAGIYATANGNHIEGNTCNDNDLGFSIVSGDNLVIRNTARANQVNFSFAAGVESGQVVNNPGAGFVNTNAWANIGY